MFFAGFKTRKKRSSWFGAAINLVIVAFLTTSLYLPQALADQMPMPLMPVPGFRVHLSPNFTPAIIRGMIIDPKNPFAFSFLVDPGDSQIPADQQREYFQKLIKYFLAAMTIAEDKQWVNLSPYERNRIIDTDFGKTEMGRDLLAQDYMLKQITASLLYPEEALGKKFWKEVYAQAAEKYGTTQIPVNTFNKVWILPDTASVYEKDNTVLIVQSHLKVMLEEDYLSLQKHAAIAVEDTDHPVDVSGVNKLGSQLVRQIILPAIEKEVNEGKNFAQLRQIYHGMVLATWYKQALRKSILTQIYANKNKVKGVDLTDPAVALQKVYRQYLRAFKKGAYNYIKEEIDPVTQQMIPRKYFSGGFERGNLAMLVVSSAKAARIMGQFLRKHTFLIVSAIALAATPQMEVLAQQGGGPSSMTAPRGGFTATSPFPTQWAAPSYGGRTTVEREAAPSAPTAENQPTLTLPSSVEPRTVVHRNPSPKEPTMLLEKPSVQPSVTTEAGMKDQVARFRRQYPEYSATIYGKEYPHHEGNVSIVGFGDKPFNYEATPTAVSFENENGRDVLYIVTKARGTEEIRVQTFDPETREFKEVPFNSLSAARKKQLGLDKAQTTNTEDLAISDAAMSNLVDQNATRTGIPQAYRKLPTSMALNFVDKYVKMYENRTGHSSFVVLQSLKVSSDGRIFGYTAFPTVFESIIKQINDGEIVAITFQGGTALAYRSAFENGKATLIESTTREESNVTAGNSLSGNFFGNIFVQDREGQQIALFIENEHVYSQRRGENRKELGILSYNSLGTMGELFIPSINLKFALKIIVNSRGIYSFDIHPFANTSTLKVIWARPVEHIIPPGQSELIAWDNQQIIRLSIAGRHYVVGPEFIVETNDRLPTSKEFVVFWSTKQSLPFSFGGLTVTWSTEGNLPQINVTNVSPFPVLAQDDVGNVEQLAKRRIDRAQGNVHNDQFKQSSPGGIDLNAANLAMSIKRDGNGVPLPLALQNPAMISAPGFVPIITDIRSAQDLPVLKELKSLATP